MIRSLNKYFLNIFLILIAILFILKPFPLHSQAEEYKPKVALVLSGGTAKGLAHIGVIEYMEEMGIKPDIIIGKQDGSYYRWIVCNRVFIDDLKNS
ncbi:MAG: hypothetical protein R2771_02465 [Saprospiraceae bacterium]